ncbi:response regulator [Chitinophaga agrisoli]|uniref:Response regulator n=1 Tax=Chitinophaga agrisoli TaxID=2607653 RepID=A0A5B2VN49_9BACT|nr:LytTR family transcriptional regulator DNA-binding domain-containing protein [Chitinophaga agrisoli]KAA2239569.1 response regulator [Chitinophaga agrisoli]
MSSLLSPSIIKTLLVDDEEIAIHRLRKALLAYPEVQVIGEAMDGASAIEAINRLRPDLVFLDIQLPGFNGLEILHRLSYVPLIVFVTAYEEYAVRAFEQQSLDYLLKPVEEERLALTMRRVAERKAPAADILQQLQQLQALLQERRTEDRISTIPVKTGNKIQLVPVGEICFFAANDKYVQLHTYQETRLVEYPLNYLQTRLPAEFVRIHRSFIINKLQIKELHKYFKGTYVVIMNDAKETRIKTAYSYAEAVKTQLLTP